MPDQTIKKLSEFGEGFRYHHENYEAPSVTALREKGGTWKLGQLTFHFPEHFGFCYGVDKAIDMVFETCDRFSAKRIFLTDQLIHNPHINGRLKEKGVRYLSRNEKHLLVCDDLKEGDVVVVSAFGTDFRDIQALKKKGAVIVDSTCGAIINVWKRVEGYAKQGFITIMHGRRNHEETRATVSQAVKEGGSYLIIENKAEAEELAAAIRADEGAKDFGINMKTCRMGMANQTTMLKGESLDIQEILRRAFRRRFGDEATLDRFRSFDTICGATQDRQDAMRGLLGKDLDLILVVGGFNSSNTTHLAELAVGKSPFYHIEGAGDIHSREQIRARDTLTGEVKIYCGWLPEDARNIGITSGASTPDVILLHIIEKIAACVL